MIAKFLSLNEELKNRIFINLGSRILGTLIFSILPIFLSNFYSNSVTGVIVLLTIISAILGNFIGGSLSTGNIKKSIFNFKIMETALIVLMLLSIKFNMIYIFIPGLISFNFFSNLRGPLLDVVLFQNIKPDDKETVMYISYWFENISVAISYFMIGIFFKTDMFKLLLAGLVINFFLIVYIYVFMKSTRSNNVLMKKNEKNIFKGYYGVIKNKRFISYIMGSSLIVMVELQIGNYFSILFKDNFPNINEPDISGIQILSIINIINTVITIIVPIFMSWQIKKNSSFQITMYIYIFHMYVSVI